jgi:hypothetical protein
MTTKADVHSGLDLKIHAIAWLGGSAQARYHRPIFLLHRNPGFDTRHVYVQDSEYRSSVLFTDRSYTPVMHSVTSHNRHVLGYSKIARSALPVSSGHSLS